MFGMRNTLSNLTGGRSSRLTTILRSTKAERQSLSLPASGKRIHRIEILANAAFPYAQELTVAYIRYWVSAIGHTRARVHSPENDRRIFDYVAADV